MGFSNVHIEHLKHDYSTPNRDQQESVLGTDILDITIGDFKELVLRNRLLEFNSDIWVNNIRYGLNG